MTGFDLVPPLLRGAAVAAPVALAVLAAAWAFRRASLSGLAAAIALAAGFWAVTGVLAASPRQLAERLPMLAMVALAAAVLASMGGRWWRVSAAGAGVAAAAWWMAGAPLHPDTLLRAAPEALALLAAMAIAAWRGGGLAMAVAWAALAAGLALAAARGPQLAYALAGMAAVLAAAPGRGLGLAAARLPLGMALAGVAAVPVLGRAGAADAAAAAAPALALLAGPLLAARLPGRLGPWLGPVLAALPALAAAALLR
jgi:hypothetical protein